MEIDSSYWYKQGQTHGRADARALKAEANPLDDDGNIRRIFAEEPDKVPAEWIEAFGRGYTTGWWET